MIATFKCRSELICPLEAITEPRTSLFYNCCFRWARTEQCWPTVTPRWSLSSCSSSLLPPSTSASWSVPSSHEVCVSVSVRSYLSDNCVTFWWPVSLALYCAACVARCPLHNTRRLHFAEMDSMFNIVCSRRCRSVSAVCFAPSSMLSSKA